MKEKVKKTDNDMRPEYEFDYSKAVRGKYYKRLLKENSNVIILEPDVAETFHDSAAVNEVLRALIKLTNSNKHLIKPDAAYKNQSSSYVWRTRHAKADRIAERNSDALYKRSVKPARSRGKK